MPLFTSFTDGLGLGLCLVILVLVLRIRSCLHHWFLRARVSGEFNIYTREAGAGVLSVAVEGPSQAKIEVIENANGYTLVSYVVTKEGNRAGSREYRPQSLCTVEQPESRSGDPSLC